MWSSVRRLKSSYSNKSWDGLRFSSVVRDGSGAKGWFRRSYTGVESRVKKIGVVTLAGGGSERKVVGLDNHQKSYMDDKKWKKLGRPGETYGERYVSSLGGVRNRWNKGSDIRGAPEIRGYRRGFGLTDCRPWVIDKRVIHLTRSGWTVFRPGSGEGGVLLHGRHIN